MLAIPNDLKAIEPLIQLSISPVILISGLGALVISMTNRMGRIVDRSREIEPRLLGSRGAEHDRWINELKLIDRRMSLVSWATFLSVLSAVLTCILVALLTPRDQVPIARPRL